MLCVLTKSLLKYTVYYFLWNLILVNNNCIGTSRNFKTVFFFFGLSKTIFYSLKHEMLHIITPYIIIMDFDWFNSRCIFRVFSYLGLISFIFTAAGVFAWEFTFFTLACIKPPNAFGICLLYLYTQSNVINQIWNPEVFRSKGFNFFPSAVVFAKTYFTFYLHVPQTAKFIRKTSTTV